jgi:hypothetical protein
MTYGGQLSNRLCRFECREIRNLVCLSLLGLLLACGLSSCSPDMTVREAEYAAKIVGDWQGTVGDSNETITFAADGKFVSEVRARGFISNTLGQGVTGTIRGTWAINGKSITLNVSSAEAERVLNRSTMSTIESFRVNEIVVKSGTGETSTFMRV